VAVAAAEAALDELHALATTATSPEHAAEYACHLADLAKRAQWYAGEANTHAAGVLHDAGLREVVLPGTAGPVEVHGKRDRKAWQRGPLLRMVLDSRLQPNPDTGELQPEDEGHVTVDDEPVTVSPDLGRVLHVWNLGAPRTTALRDRGIDPDEFCTSTWGGRELRLPPADTVTGKRIN